MYFNKIEEYAFDNSTFDPKMQDAIKQKIKKYKSEVNDLQKRINLNNRTNGSIANTRSTEDNLLLQENYILSESVKKLNNAQDLTINMGNELERNRLTMMKSLSTVL